MKFAKISEYAVRTETGHKICKCFDGENWKYMIYAPGENLKLLAVCKSFEECKRKLKNDQR